MHHAGDFRNHNTLLYLVASVSDGHQAIPALPPILSLQFASMQNPVWPKNARHATYFIMAVALLPLETANSCESVLKEVAAPMA